MKKFTKMVFALGVTFALGIGAVTSYLVAQPKEQLSDLTLANIEALGAFDEGPSMLGCKYKKHATCYVFDGDGDLVDRRKNEYPGK